MQPQDPNQSNQYQPPQPPVGTVPLPMPGESNPQPMYYTRPLEPQQPVLTPEIRQRHDESKHKYPHLNLSEGEYVISDVRRHPIGLIQIWGIVTLAVAAILGMTAMVVAGADSMSVTIPTNALAGGGFLLSLLVIIGGYIGAYVYRANRFYLTNESVIQNIQQSLFANREQTVSLANIEDASYTRRGLIQSILNYGSIRLSTEGDETTYRFPYASDPQKQVAILNNAVESFKNGRPIISD